VIIKDNKPDSTDAKDKAKAASNNVNAIRAERDTSQSITPLNQNLASKLSKLIDQSALER
jgi:hypothetical protein